jgi:hypothetical protein
LAAAARSGEEFATAVMLALMLVHVGQVVFFNVR